MLIYVDRQKSRVEFQSYVNVHRESTHDSLVCPMLLEATVSTNTNGDPYLPQTAPTRIMPFGLSEIRYI